MSVDDPFGLKPMRVSTAVALPRDDDGVEAALIAQMAGAHEAAMDCLARAVEAGRSDAARATELRLGTRLLAIYSWQVRTLDVWQRGRSAVATRQDLVVGWSDGDAPDGAQDVSIEPDDPAAEA